MPARLLTLEFLFGERVSARGTRVPDSGAQRRISFDHTECTVGDRFDRHAIFNRRSCRWSAHRRGTIQRVRVAARRGTPRLPNVAIGKHRDV